MGILSQRKARSRPTMVQTRKPRSAFRSDAAYQAYMSEWRKERNRAKRARK